MKSEPCVNLGTKKLYVPALEADAFKEKPQPGFEGHFWCTCTGNEVGPDDRPVNLRGCSNPQRDCYRDAL